MDTISAGFRHRPNGAHTPRGARVKLGLLAALGTLAALPATAGDLPAKATDGRVRACSAQGQGFYYIPGSDTCLQIGGFAQMEGYYNTYTDYPAVNDKTYTISTVSLTLDARTSTEYGVLRSFADVRFLWRTADMFSDGPTGAQIDPYYMYIQFVGFTIGHQQSYFDFYANANIYGTDPGTVGDQTRLNLIAYTWEMGHGFTTTFSVEDPSARMQGVNLANPTVDGTDSYQTQGWPEFVAAFGQTGDWGQFQLSGALHQVEAALPDSTTQTADAWGYALQAGVMFNLPFIAKNDTLYIQAAYANGAISYLGIQDYSGDFPPPDGFLSPTGQLSLVTGWNATAQYLHNWTPTWNTAVFGGYAAFSFNDALASALYGATGGTNYNVGANINWMPNASLQMTLQYDFNVFAMSNYTPTAYGLPVSSQQAHQVLITAQRFF